MQARRVATLLPTTLVACCIFALALPQPVAAQSKAQSVQTIPFQIDAGSLDSVLNKFATQSKLQVVYSPELVAGKTSIGLSGNYSPQQALKALLKDQEIAWDAVNSSMYVLRPTSRSKGVAPKKPSQPSSSKRQLPRDDGSTSEVQELEKMVVVGSRLGTSPVESAMPITVITREQIDRSGAGNIAQVLSQLSEVSVNNNGDRDIGATPGTGTGANINATTVQMRGLPRGSTLVLINGRRAGESASLNSTGQFDLSTIPLSLVERIEVLPAGASAIYGGDGLAGVVNVVLRRDANGLEVRLRQTHADNFDTTQYSAVYGRTWSKGDLTTTLSWRENDGLLNYERALTADQDYRRFGGSDFRSDSTNPGTVYSLAGCPAPPRTCSIPIAQRGNLPGLDSPFAGTPEGQNGTGLTPADFLATQGLQKRDSSRRHIFSAEKAYGVGINGRLELGKSVEGFTELSYNRREVPAQQIALGFSGGIRGSADSVLPANHPFNPFGVRVGINYLLLDTGFYASYKSSNTRVLAGLRQDGRRFDWELTGWRSQDVSVTGGSIGIRGAALASVLSSTDPSTTINPFVGDGSLPASREFLATMFAPVNQRAESTTDGLSAFVRGRIAKLPTGSMVGLLGGEHLTQSVFLRSDSPHATVKNVNGSTSSNAIFGEVRIPLMSARERAAYERLALTGAIRSESSERFDGDTRTETVGLELRPTNSLLLRSTYSTAFRPLLAFNALQETTYGGGTVFDPQFGGQQVDFDVIVQGGIPDGMKPEQSATATLGFVYTPAPGARISMTLWDIKFRDRIAYLGSQTLVDNEQYFGHRIIRDPNSGVITSMDLRQVNIFHLNSQGVDVGFDGSLDTDVGNFYASLGATYTYKYEEQLAAGAPLAQRVGIRNSLGWAPRWKIVPRITWDYKQWLNGTLSARYVSSYRDSAPLATGPDAGTYLYLGGVWRFDTNFELSLNRFVRDDSLLARTKVAIGVNNIFDKAPQFCMGCGATGYDSSQDDIFGRTIYAELRMSL